MSLDQYVKLLTHQDSEQRKKAIIALGKSGDKSALPHLSKVYKTDPNPELRDLALRAGKNIQKNASAVIVAPEPQQFSFSQPETSHTSSPSYSYSSPPENAPDWMMSAASTSSSAAPTKAKVVTENDRKRARASLDRAIDFSMKQKWQDAIFFLNEAIERNPEMENDSMLLGLAAQVTGASGPRAIEELKKLKGQTKKPSVKRASAPGEATFGEFILEWPIWLIVMGLVFSAATFGFINYATDWLDEDLAFTSDTGDYTYVDENGNLVTITSTGETLESEVSLDDVKEFVNEYGAITSLALGFGMSIATMLYLTFSNYVTWFVGGFMGGTGALFNFMTGTMRVDAITSIISTLLYVGIIVGTVSASNEATVEDVQNLTTLQCISGIAVLVLLGVKCWVVGQKHEFGIGLGIANVIVGYIATSIVFFCCWCGLLSALSSSSASAFLILL